MSQDRDAKSAKALALPEPRRHKQPTDAYVANVVSQRELRHFMHRGAAGDLAVAWVAGRQLGLITSRQLEMAGIGRGAVRSRCTRGMLHRTYRGVYLVGHSTPLPGARELAALLACSGQAVISHRSAAAFWKLATPPPDEVQVTVVGRHCKTRDGLRIHRVEQLEPRDRRTRFGIAVTAPARTVVDFASEATADELEQAIAEAHALGLATERQIRAAADRRRNRPGVGMLRAELRREAGPALTRSGGERRLVKLIRAANLPQPLVNARVSGFVVDAVWPAHRVIVELDGYLYHGHRGAFERDHRKDVALDDARYHVIRITGRQLVSEPFGVIAHIARVLDRHAPSSSRDPG